jgi:hypothetical protein
MQTLPRGYPSTHLSFRVKTAEPLVEESGNDWLIRSQYAKEPAGYCSEVARLDLSQYGFLLGWR